MNRKPIFDAVRKMLPLGFTQPQVDQLDRAIDEALGIAPAGPAPRQIGAKGTALVMEFEGLAKVRDDGRVEAYPDPGTGGDPWTIGWGATGPGIRKGTVWTREQCDERLARDLATFSDEVVKALEGAPTTQDQFDALVSFHYNTGAIATATLTKKHIAGEYTGAAREFGRWIHADGRVMGGLVRRRAAEAALYRGER